MLSALFIPSGAFLRKRGENPCNLQWHLYCPRGRVWQGLWPWSVPDEASTNHPDLRSAEVKGCNIRFGGLLLVFRYSKCIFDTHVVSLCTHVSLSPYPHLFYFSSGNVSDFKKLSGKLGGNPYEKQSCYFLFKFFSAFISFPEHFSYTLVFEPLIMV